jgi:hypothetical protein
MKGIGRAPVGEREDTRVMATWEQEVAALAARPAARSSRSKPRHWRIYGDYSGQRPGRTGGRWRKRRAMALRMACTGAYRARCGMPGLALVPFSPSGTPVPVVRFTPAPATLHYDRHPRVSAAPRHQALARHTPGSKPPVRATATE